MLTQGLRSSICRYKQLGLGTRKVEAFGSLGARTVVTTECRQRVLFRIQVASRQLLCLGPLCKPSNSHVSATAMPEGGQNCQKTLARNRWLRLLQALAWFRASETQVWLAKPGPDAGERSGLSRLRHVRKAI